MSVQAPYPFLWKRLHTKLLHVGERASSSQQHGEKPWALVDIWGFQHLLSGVKPASWLKKHRARNYSYESNCWSRNTQSERIYQVLWFHWCFFSYSWTHTQCIARWRWSSQKHQTAPLLSDVLFLSQLQAPATRHLWNIASLSFPRSCFSKEKDWTGSDSKTNARAAEFESERGGGLKRNKEMFPISKRVYRKLVVEQLDRS